MMRTDTDEFSPQRVRIEYLEARDEFIRSRTEELCEAGMHYDGALAEAEEEWEGEEK